MQTLNQVTPSLLQQIQVRHQDKILELTGSRLEPAKAYEIIKKETKGFKESNPKAEQAANLFMALLRLNGISLPGQAPEKPNEQNRLQLQERERARTLELLELELTLN